jgi:hypothetical protein
MADEAKLVQSERWTLANAHWFAIAALAAAFAISLFVGVISRPYALSALIVGAISFFSIIARMRYHTKLANFVFVSVLVFGSDIAGHYDDLPMGTPHLSWYPFTLFNQWFALVVAVVFVLLALFRKPIARYCRLDENP